MKNHNLLIVTIVLIMSNIISANNVGIESVTKQLESEILQQQKMIKNGVEVNLENIKILNEKLLELKKIKSNKQVQNKILNDNILRKKIIYKTLLLNNNRDDGGESNCNEVGGNEIWLGDGWCDDYNNNEACEFDGGDCCYSTCVSGDYDCEADTGPCVADICIDPEGNNDDCDEGGEDNGDDGGEECDFFDCVGTPACGYESWLGDGICDDGTWGIVYDCEEFNYDEGDCEENGDDGGWDDGGESNCNEVGGNEIWVGDGFCDNSNNNETCEFDGGDCCYSTCVSGDYDCEADTGPCVADICIDPEGNNDGCNEDGGDDGGWDDGGNPEECGEGYLFDCSGDGDCCPESWIGDGYSDCEDQAWGCDMSCYDNDGGDCEESEDGGDGGEDGDFEECQEGTVDDCSGDGDCCPEGWIGDGYGDCEDQAYGCDLSCYDNDGGDCEEGGDGGEEDGCWEDGEFYCVGCELWISECEYFECTDDGWDGPFVIDECEDNGCEGLSYEECVESEYCLWLSLDPDEVGGECVENDWSDDGGEDGDLYECEDLGYEDCEWLDYCIWTDEGCAFVEENDEDCDGLDYESCLENEYCSWISPNPDEIDGECVGNDWNDDGGDDWEDDSVTTLLIGDSESILGEMLGEGIQYGVEVPLLYISSEPIGGIQFTISDYPDWVTGFEMTSTIEDCFTANFNDVEGSFIGILFSLEGCDLDAVDGPTQFATISYELHEDAGWGENVELFFSDAIVSDGLGNALSVNAQGNSINVSVLGDVSSDSEVNVLDVVTLINFILFIESPSDYQFWAGDVNQDGALNVLDVVIMVDIILE